MVGLKVETDFYPIGSSDFFLSFFDNIHNHLEDKKEWGSHYPILLNELYRKGKIRLADIDTAEKELIDVREEFKKLPAEKAIFGINDLTKQPPLGTNISDEIADLSNCFVTTDGRDLFNLMIEAFELARIYKWDVIVWNMFKAIEDQPKPDQLGK